MNREGLESIDRIISERKAEIAETQRLLKSQQAELDHFIAVREYFRNHPELVTGDATPSQVVRDAIEEILLGAMGDGLHYRQIWDQLKDRGIRVGGEDPARTVGAHLSGDHRFESLGSGMWALRRWVKRPQPEPSTSTNGNGSRAESIRQMARMD